MMKGFLSFLLLWMINKKEMTGAEIAEELRIRKGHKPSPGTLYPALKDLKKKGLVKTDDQKRYSLTDAGQEELQRSIESFLDTFWDIDEMRECCCRDGHHGHGFHPHPRRFQGRGNDCCDHE